MKRNLDLCYLILQKIVDSNEDYYNIQSIEGFSDNELFFNANLLNKQCFIEAVVEFYMKNGNKIARIKNASLTWTGFDLYDQMTSERTFSVKNGVAKTNITDLDHFYNNYHRM